MLPETLLGEDMRRGGCPGALVCETRLLHPSPVSTIYLPYDLEKFTFSGSQILLAKLGLRIQAGVAN